MRLAGGGRETSAAAFRRGISVRSDADKAARA